MFFETKTVKPWNLKGTKREQFQGRCVSYFPPPFMFSFLGKFSASLLTEVKGGFVSTAVAFSFHYYPWWNVAYWNQNNKKHCKTIQNIKTDLTIHMFFWRRKELNRKILRVVNVNSFRDVFFIILSPTCY